MQKRVTTWILMMMMMIGLVLAMGASAWAENSRYRVGSNSWIVAADETLNEATDDNVLLLRGTDGRVQVDTDGTDPYPFVVSVDGLKKFHVANNGDIKAVGDIETMGVLDFGEFSTGNLRIRLPGFGTGNTYGVWWYQNETLGFGKNTGSVDDAIMFDLSSGNADFLGSGTFYGGVTTYGDLGMVADQGITQPADSVGDGPLQISNTLVFGGSNVDADLTNGAFVLNGTNTYTLKLGPLEAEAFGGTVVYDYVAIAGLTADASTYIDSVTLKNNSGGNVTALATYTDDIGNGSAGVFAQQINTADVDRYVYDGIWWIEVVVQDGGSAPVYIADLRLAGHYEAE